MTLTSSGSAARCTWAGNSVPIIPESVAPENEWFNQHVIYTHSDVGIKMLEANTGVVVDESQFFEQRRIYYGESGDGLFSTYWSAYPVDRMESAEARQVHVQRDRRRGRCSPAELDV